MKQPRGRRVVVTGIGTVTPGGLGRDRFWRTVTGDRSQVGPITRFECRHYRTRIAAEIKDFDPLAFIDPKRARRMDRSAQFAVVAARLAVEDAGLDMRHGRCVGICLGTSAGGAEFGGHQLFKAISGDYRRVSPHVAVSAFPGSLSGYVSIDLGVHGPGILISTGCTASADAIGYALQMLRSGKADMMLAGGSEAPIAPFTLQAFSSLGALSSRNDEPERASRPFDRERDGFVLAEGSVVLVLENLEAAILREARIYGEIGGYATTSDGYHMTAPGPEGTEAARAIMLALREAGVSRSEVNYVSAHGSSTPLNDKTETKVLKKVFGDEAHRLAVSSIKSSVGHASGAAGAMQAAASLLALFHQTVPPTLNYEHSDPECDLDYVPDGPREMTVEAVVQNTYAFGGKNSVLVYKRFRPRAHPHGQLSLLPSTA